MNFIFDFYFIEKLVEGKGGQGGGLSCQVTKWESQ